MLRMNRVFIICFIAFLSHSSCLAQHEYDVWYFGYGHGLDFRTTPPTVLTGTPSNTLEGSAMYCNPVTGEPMFGCDGDSIIYDRTGKPMPNGKGILAGRRSSSQGAAIIPLECKGNKYLVVTTDQNGYIKPCLGSHYSLVDMSLNGGLGDVTAKNVLINPGTDEHLAVTYDAAGVGYWVILHSRLGDNFFSYHVTSVGISVLPVISNIQPDLNAYDSIQSPTGILKASPNGKKLAATLTNGFVSLYDFDNITGVVSNAVNLSSKQGPASEPLGVCFSPDSKKLYITDVGTDEYRTGIYQYDLTNKSAGAIILSRQLVPYDSENIWTGSKCQFEGLEIGPDGKMYVIAFWTLGVIEYPNERVPACRVKDTLLSILSKANYSFPNNIEGRPVINRNEFDVQLLKDTITPEGIIMPVLLKMQDTTSFEMLISYDTADVELLSVISGREEVLPTSSSPGLYSFNLTGSMIKRGIQLNWRMKEGSAKESTTIHLVNSRSCLQSTQDITLSLQCGYEAISSFMRRGKIPDFTINPNPARNSLHVTLNNYTDPIQYELFDELGITRKKGIASENIYSIDLTGLAEGNYYLRISLAYGAIVTKRVIIKG